MFTHHKIEISGQYTSTLVLKIYGLQARRTGQQCALKTMISAQNFTQIRQT